jgi:hypothetical protein
VDIFGTTCKLLSAKSAVYSTKKALEEGKVRLVDSFEIPSFDKQRLTKYHNQDTDGYFYAVQWRLEIVRRGLHAFWKFVVPKTGSFPNPEDWSQYDERKCYVTEYQQSNLVRTAAFIGDKIVSESAT